MNPTPIAVAEQCASGVPPLAHEEAAHMARVELERFLTFLESLTATDWQRPTACTLWNVREVVAHVTGATHSWTSWKALIRDYGNPLPLRPYQKRGMNILDATNQYAVDRRAGGQPADLITELRHIGPQAIAMREGLPALVRNLKLPIPTLGFVPVHILTDLIYTRDMWVHRLDICRAIGREMEIDPAQDGRLLALVMRDLDARLRKALATSVVYHVSGAFPAIWSVGPDGPAGAQLEIDAFDLVWMGAGRLRADEMWTDGSVQWSGDQALAERALEETRFPV
jgi:uncharacterized protein (TIGR03083 family)